MKKFGDNEKCKLERLITSNNGNEMMDFVNMMASQNNLTPREFIEQDADQLVKQLDSMIHGLIKLSVEANIDCMSEKERAAAQELLDTPSIIGEVLASVREERKGAVKPVQE